MERSQSVKFPIAAVFATIIALRYSVMYVLNVFSYFEGNMNYMPLASVNFNLELLGFGMLAILLYMRKINYLAVIPMVALTVLYTIQLFDSASVFVFDWIGLLGNGGILSILVAILELLSIVFLFVFSCLAAAGYKTKSFEPIKKIWFIPGILQSLSCLSFLIYFIIAQPIFTFDMVLVAKLLLFVPFAFSLGHWYAFPYKSSAVERK